MIHFALDLDSTYQKKFFGKGYYAYCEYIKQSLTKKTYYPVAIQIKDSTSIEHCWIFNEMKTIPILLKQSNGNYKDKADYIFYFKFTDELAATLKDVKDLSTYQYQPIKNNFKPTVFITTCNLGIYREVI